MHLDFFKKNGFLILFILSIFLQKYYIEVGFSLKPFMLISLFYLLIYIKNFKLISSPFEPTLLFTFFVFMLGGLFSKYPEMSLRLTLGIVLVLACYSVMKYIFSKYSLRDLEKSILIAYGIFLTISLALYATGITLNQGVYGRFVAYGVMHERNMYRLIGTITDPNFFAFYSTIPFFILLKRKKQILTLNILFILSFISILLTISRGGILSIFFSIILFALYSITNNKSVSFKNIRLRKKGVSASILYIILASLIIYIINKYSLLEVFLNVLNNRVDNFEDGSGRTTLWSNALELFSESPIFGIGLFNFFNYNSVIFNDPHFLHNTHLEVLIENGLLGFFLYFLLIMHIILVAYKILKHDKNYDYILFCGIALLLQMTFISALLNEIFFMYLALLTVIYREVKSNSRLKQLR